MYCAPSAQASFSKLRVQRSLFSRRNLAAEAEIWPAFGSFGAHEVVDLDTGICSASSPKKRCEARADSVWKRGFAPLGRGGAPSPHKKPLIAARLLSNEPPCP